MSESTLLATAVTHQLYAALLHVAGGHDVARDGESRDRGAVSLEQVLWFVAAGVSVAVIASILWGKIRGEAEKSITPPAAP